MRQQRSTVLMPPLLTGMSSGARVNSQANWLLIIFKASQHIKKNLWENTLMIWFWMLLAFLWFSLLLLCFSLFIPVVWSWKTSGSNTFNTPRGIGADRRTLEQSKMYKLGGEETYSSPIFKTNKQKIISTELSMTMSYISDVQQLWKWIVSVSIMKRQARY